MDDEPILLHEPNLMRAILHTAHDRPAGHDDAMAELEVTLRAAHEPMPEDRAELAGRLNEAFDLLAAAAALAPAGDGRYRLTKRGAELLASHPQGIDQTILAAFPEFQRFLARRQQPAAPWTRTA